MDQDDKILVKKESKIKFTPLVQDKMEKMIWYTLKKNLRSVTISNARRIGERPQC